MLTRKMKVNIGCSTSVFLPLLLFIVFLLLECSYAGPTKRRACKYRKGTWSSCNFQNKDRSQTLVQTLVPGSASKCEPSIVITRSCITASNEAEPRLKMMDHGGGTRREGKKSREEQKRKQKHKRKEQNKSKEKMNHRKTLPELLRYPSPPRMLDVVPQATFADLSWQPPDVADLDHDLHVLSYKIGYGVGFPDRHTLKVNGTSTTYRLLGLEPDTVYIVSLRTKTKMGLSEALYMYFRTQNIKQASEEVILPPVGVRPVAESAEAIKISWVDPSRGEEKALEKKQYHVRYRPLSHLSGSSPMEDFKTFNTSNTFLLVEDLQPFTKYEFSVMASDEEGRNSMWSAMAWSVTQEAAPSTSPEDLTVIEDPANSGRIVLTWQPPSRANGIITGYEVSYNTLSLEGLSAVKTKEVKGSKLSVTLVDLIPGETYEFSVQARNSQGIGPPLTIRKHLTLEDSAPEEEDDEESTTAFVADAPRDLLLNVLSSTSGILSWQDPGLLETIADDITSTYTVRYHSLDMKLANYIVLSSPFSTSSLYIDDLTPTTWYEFMVKVRRGDQESSWSMPVRNKTFEADLYQRPLQAEVRGQKRSPQTAILTWQPDPELRIQEYLILYKSDLGQTSRHWTQEAAVGPDVHQHVVERLKPGTTHYFIVQAVAEVGPRPRSKILSYMIPAEDSLSFEIPQPENLQVTVMSSHSALVSWLDPAVIRDSQEKQENRPVASNTYTLRYRELTQRSSGYRFTFPTLSSIFMVDLQPATGYEFSVRTDKGDRHSEWSVPVVNRTFEAAPSSSPSNVTVTMDDGDPTAVILKWRPPEFSNGDITGYLVFYETANGRKSLTAPGGELSYRIQFLKPQTKYFFRVGARNSQGFSPLSNRVIYRTPRVIGTAPTDVTVSSAPEDPYNVIISWQPPSPNRRKIKHYTITHYTEDDDKHRSVTTVPGSTLTTVVKKLLPSTAYLFTVQAYYQKGGGPHSAVIKYSIPKDLLQNR